MTVKKSYNNSLVAFLSYIKIAKLLLKMDEYLPGGQVLARIGNVVSLSTIRTWANNDKIRVRRIQGGKRYYNFTDVQSVLGISPAVPVPTDGKSILGYARSIRQPDLERQVTYIKEHSGCHDVISDVGSGLNFNRKGLCSLLSKVESGVVSKVVVTYRDRLCRYGIELVERIFRKNGTELLVLCDEGNSEGSAEAELAADLLDICNYFVAKRNGKKSARYRAERAASNSFENKEIPLEVDSSSC